MNKSTLATPWRALNAYCARHRPAAFFRHIRVPGLVFMKRKVAAIVAADIAGQSRLVADDAQETLRRLTSSRQVRIFAVGPGGRSGSL
ncbi:MULTISPECIES: hypothetical protein [Bradyrhizobium]|uniref:hypothetical protein n=1 Tax=Bradyrhizobium TaxID=374 RepID=UPI001FF045E2|nr:MULTISPECIES: hypothetical protein [Bradyrhizobium]